VVDRTPRSFVLIGRVNLYGRAEAGSGSALSYPGLEIVAKLATVLEVEPADLLKLRATTDKRVIRQCQYRPRTS
jgi:hypothetical protein